MYVHVCLYLQMYECVYICMHAQALQFMYLLKNKFNFMCMYHHHSNLCILGRSMGEEPGWGGLCEGLLQPVLPVPGANRFVRRFEGNRRRHRHKADVQHDFEGVADQENCRRYYTYYVCMYVYMLCMHVNIHLLKELHGHCQ